MFARNKACLRLWLSGRRKSCVTRRKKSGFRLSIATAIPSGRVGARGWAFKRPEGQSVDDIQHIVDFMGWPAAAAGWASGTQWPNAAIRLRVLLTCAAASREVFQRAKRRAIPGRSSSAAASAWSRSPRRVASIGSSGEGGGGRERRLVKPANRMRGAACAGTWRRRRPEELSQRIEERKAYGARTGSAGCGVRLAAAARAKSAGDSMTAMPRRRRAACIGFGWASRATAAASPPGRAPATMISRRAADFGRAQQPQHGAVEMAGQGKCRGQFTFFRLRHVLRRRAFRRKESKLSPRSPAMATSMPGCASAPPGSSRLPHSSPSPPPFKSIRAVRLSRNADVGGQIERRILGLH